MKDKLYNLLIKLTAHFGPIPKVIYEPPVKRIKFVNTTNSDLAIRIIDTLMWEVHSNDKDLKSIEVTYNFDSQRTPQRFVFSKKPPYSL